MYSHRPSATSQPSLFSHTHNLMAEGCCDGGVCYTEKATAVMEACMAAVPVGAMRLLGCPFERAWCSVGDLCLLAVVCVDCRCSLSSVFLGGARCLKLSTCYTTNKATRNVQYPYPVVTHEHWHAIFGFVRAYMSTSCTHICLRSYSHSRLRTDPSVVTKSGKEKLDHSVTVQTS